MPISIMTFYRARGAAVVSAVKSSIYAGEDLKFTASTTDIPSGTTMYWRILGNVVASNFSPASLTGSDVTSGSVLSVDIVTVASKTMAGKQVSIIVGLTPESVDYEAASLDRSPLVTYLTSPSGNVTLLNSTSWTAPTGVYAVTYTLTAAGGGAGGKGGDGGMTLPGNGGNGGLTTGSAVCVPGNSYPVVVGAGGAGGVTYPGPGDGGAGGASSLLGNNAGGGGGGSKGAYHVLRTNGAPGTGTTLGGGALGGVGWIPAQSDKGAPGASGQVYISW